MKTYNIKIYMCKVNDIKRKNLEKIYKAFHSSFILVYIIDLYDQN